MEDLLQELFIIAVLSTVVIFACYKVKIPPIVGFLITGAAFGPSALGLVRDIEAVNLLSEIGVVFLLFSIGLEISVSELIRLRKPVFIGGMLQVGLTILVFWQLAEWVWHDTTGADLFVGFLIALSSTAIVLKEFQQKAMMDGPAGRIGLSMLIYQDLVIVPMMLAVPLLAGKGTDANMVHLSLTAAKTLGIVVGVFLLARKFVPWCLRIVISTKSRELFLISVIGICLGTAFFTAEVGLSLSLGAFMAGLVVAESEYSHSALEGILPFKDVFTSVFFISVGMLLDMAYFAEHYLEVFVVTLLVLVLKSLLVTGATMLMRYPLRTSIVVGMALCQVGEFSFVLAKSGLSEGLLTRDHYQLFLASSILTMVATPFLISAAPAAARLIAKTPRGKSGKADDEAGSHDAGLSDHLIILGYGVGGKLLARAARMSGIRYIILEMNPDTVKRYAAEGEPIHYGDAIHPAVLENLGIRKARVLAVVISDPLATRSVTEIARHLNHQLHILVRTRFLGEVAALKELGASEVIPEEFETAIEIFTRVLSKYLVPRGGIEQFVQEVRAENYDMLRKVNLPGTSLSTLQKQIPDLTASAVVLEKDAPLDGKTLLESGLRKENNVMVIAVRRGAEYYGTPEAGFRLQEGDTVYIFSTAKDAAIAAPLFSGTGVEREGGELLQDSL